jgi:hypothetical protein
MVYVVQSSTLRNYSRDELTVVDDSRRARRVGCGSDLRLLELTRFRLDGVSDSRCSNGLFALFPFAALVEEGCPSVDSRASAGISFLDTGLPFRPQQTMYYLKDIK